MSKDFIDFNKQILSGEVGALLGIQLFLLVGQFFSDNASMLAWLATLGSVVGAATFWLATRSYDEKRKQRLSVKGMAKDVAYYTPAAVIIVVLIYLPLLQFLTEYLLTLGGLVSISGLLAQVLAFLAFLLLINSYRLVLGKYFGKRL